MKTDILTYITRCLVKQRGVNIILVIGLGACLFKIGSLETQIKALKEKAEGESY